MADPLADLARMEGVPSAVQAARDAVDAVLRDRGLRRFDDETRARARWASAVASADLEELSAPGPGGEVGADEAADGRADGRADEQADERREQRRAAVLRLYAELPELAGAVRHRPPQVLARAHALLGRGSLDDDALGRLRAGVDRLRFDGLTTLLTSTTVAPVPVLAAVAHAEVATLRPFGTGDGVLARALERMVLVDGGVDPPSMIVTEAGHLRAGADYARLLAGYATGRADAVRAWVLHCVAAIVHGAEVSPVARRR
ncbi:hypothetical protein FHX74_001602 [Friedmanniella endophytica]|uniref:Fido domain-containing protein n=1 Tax=Microlunatus kandeliicorticis TaxID=1759536 RepID=A0A7W3IRP4_9ACTN|nr:oxidoreductase [Microlunatus kandeliicorticis]MBA8793997.1 hypothetical protein [Microlunatus kandeliicorticis]